MHTLAIETSAGICSCAVLKDTDVIEQIHFKTKDQQQTLMPSIEKLFKTTGLKKAEINLVAVDIGPGAFTALRIGVATAKTLAHALNIPVVGINSLYATYKLSLDTVSGDYDRVILIDARRSKLFCSFYFANGEEKTNLDLSVNDVLYLTNNSDKILFAGNGAEIYKNELKSKLEKKNVQFLFGDKTELTAGLIGKLAVEKYKKSGSDNLHSLVPVYIRETDAVTKGR